MAYDDYEKNTSNELEQTGKHIKDDIDNIIDLSRRQEEQKKAASSNSNKSNGKKGKKDEQGKGKKGNEKNSSGSKGKSGSQGGQGASKAASEGAKEAAKKSAEETAKIAAKAAAAAATGGTGMIAGAAMERAIKKTAKATIIFLLCFHVFICTFMFLLPFVLLEALVYDTARMVIGSVLYIRSEFFGYDDYADLPKEEQERILEEETKKFFGNVGRACSGITHAGYTLMNWLDNITDDNTLIGGWIDDAKTWLFGATVSIDQAVESYLDKDYDAESYMPLLVMQRLRAYYSDTTQFISLDQLKNTEEDAEKELLRKYGTNANPEQTGTSCDASTMLRFFTIFNATANLPACNVPIKITGKDNFVSLDGELIGEIDEENETQTLDDCIVYNPYGNTRSGMNMSLGSNYELYTHASYIIAIYSASTPYGDQSLADMLSKLDDGLQDYFEKEDSIKYTYHLTDVYRGALVPRFYQPIVYKNDNNEWGVGTYVKGYFAPSVSENAGTLGPDYTELLGMKDNEALQEQGYHKEVPYGWFDINGDGLGYNDKREMYPIVCQTLGSPIAESGTVLPSSYCVVATDPRRCNINFDYHMNHMSINDILNNEDSRGFYIYGSEAGRQTYGSINWQDEFTRQLEAQQAFYDSGKMSEKTKKEFAFRFQMPFTRTSYSDDFHHCQFVPIDTTRNEVDMDALALMSYCDKDGNNQYTFNGSQINGYYAWCYIYDFDIDRFQLYIPDEIRGESSVANDVSIYREMSPDNWSLYEEVDGHYYMTKADGYQTRDWLYHSKIRYFISVDVTAQTDFLDSVASCFNYEPAGATPGYSSDMYVAEVDQGQKGFRETQGEYAMGVYQNYLDLLGVDPGEVVAANPVLGSEVQYTYTEMLSIVRNLTNADGTPVTMNQKYLAYCAIAAAGHMLYQHGQYGGTLEPGIDFTAWIQDAETHDPNSKWPDRVGTDCSGFVSWAYMTAFKDAVLSSRFDTTALVVHGGEHAGTKEVREGKLSATSYLGEVFTNQKDLKVGDVSIYIKWVQHVDTSGTNNTGRVTWERKAHAMMYLGIDKDDPNKHIWIEMTRYNSVSAPNGQVNGVRIMSYEDYGAKKDAVFIRLSKKIPTEDVAWTEVSPSWMMIPKQGEV